MDQSNGALTVRVSEIGVELPQLAHQEHAFVNDGPAGEGGDVGVDVGLFKGPPGHIKLPVEVQALRAVRRTLHEALADPGHTVQGLLPQHLGMHRHIPPAKKLHTLLGHDDFQHFLRLGPFELILWEKEHAHAIVLVLPQGNIQILCCASHQLMGDLEQQANAVAGLSGGILARPMLQLFHDFQGLVHGVIGFAALDVHHRADAAGVVLELGTV